MKSITRIRAGAPRTKRQRGSIRAGRHGRRDDVARSVRSIEQWNVVVVVQYAGGPAVAAWNVAVAASLAVYRLNVSSEEFCLVLCQHVERACLEGNHGSVLVAGRSMTIEMLGRLLPLGSSQPKQRLRNVGRNLRHGTLSTLITSQLIPSHRRTAFMLGHCVCLHLGGRVRHCSQGKRRMHLPLHIAVCIYFSDRCLHLFF
jgi:hypothetical protein